MKISIIFLTKVHNLVKGNSQKLPKIHIFFWTKLFFKCVKTIWKIYNIVNLKVFYVFFNLKLYEFWILESF